MAGGGNFIGGGPPGFGATGGGAFDPFGGSGGGGAFSGLFDPFGSLSDLAGQVGGGGGSPIGDNSGGGGSTAPQNVGNDVFTNPLVTAPAAVTSGDPTGQGPPQPPQPPPAPTFAQSLPPGMSQVPMPLPRPPGAPQATTQNAATFAERFAPANWQVPPLQSTADPSQPADPNQAQPITAQVGAPVPNVQVERGFAALQQPAQDPATFAERFAPVEPSPNAQVESRFGGMQPPAADDRDQINQDLAGRFSGEPWQPNQQAAPDQATPGKPAKQPPNLLQTVGKALTNAAKRTPTGAGGQPVMGGGQPAGGPAGGPPAGGPSSGAGIDPIQVLSDLLFGGPGASAQDLQKIANQVSGYGPQSGPQGYGRAAAPAAAQQPPAAAAQQAAAAAPETAGEQVSEAVSGQQAGELPPSPIADAARQGFAPAATQEAGQQPAQAALAAGTIPGSRAPVGTRPPDPFYDPVKYTQATFQIESGGNPHAVTGSNRGLGQFGPAEEREFGITPQNRSDPRAQAAALGRETRRNTAILRNRLGREPTPAELYLMHQQGVAGGPALLSANPNTPAWQVLRPYYRSPTIANRAIVGNLPRSDPLRTKGSNITAGEFVGWWRNRFNREMARQPARQGMRAEATEFAPQLSQIAQQWTPQSMSLG